MRNKRINLFLKVIKRKIHMKTKSDVNDSIVELE